MLGAAVMTFLNSTDKTIAWVEVDASHPGTAMGLVRPEVDKLVMAVELVYRKALSQGSIGASPVKTTPILFGPPPSYSGGPASIVPTDVPRLEAVIGLLDVKPPKRVETALLEFDTALKSRDVRRQYIHSVVALEALFGDAHPEMLRYKIALRGAQLIPSLQADKKAGFDRLRNAYDTRSQFVHGTWDKGTLKQAEADAENLLNLTSEAILAFLERAAKNLTVSFPDLDDELFLR
jgi:hypothetical protein